MKNEIKARKRDANEDGNGDGAAAVGPLGGFPVDRQLSRNRNWPRRQSSAAQPAAGSEADSSDSDGSLKPKFKFKFEIKTKTKRKRDKTKQKAENGKQ